MKEVIHYKMKKLAKIITTLILILFSLNSFSQVIVDGVDVNLEEVSYCQIVGKSNLLGTKVKIFVDYGQKISWSVRQVIRDKEGTIMKFNTVIDALNFMKSNGWKYVNNYAISYGTGSVYYYLLEK